MKQLTYISVLMVLISCGAKKTITNTTSAEDISATKLVDEYYAGTLEYTTFEARTKARYSSNGKAKPGVTVQIRIEKDKTIWLDASLIGFSGGRALITPAKIKFYDKINRQYFDNDFSFLSEYAGIDLDFDQLQRLLTGQTIYDLREGKYNFVQEQGHFTVSPKKANPLFDLLFEIGTQPFVVQKQEVVVKEDNSTMYISYGAYAEVEGKPFPTQLNVEANDGKRLTEVQIEYRNVSLNNELRFPFKIPSGYKEIVIDEKN